MNQNQPSDELLKKGMRPFGGKHKAHARMHREHMNDFDERMHEKIAAYKKMGKDTSFLEKYLYNK